MYPIDQTFYKEAACERTLSRNSFEVQMLNFVETTQRSKSNQTTLSL